MGVALVTKCVVNAQEDKGGGIVIHFIVGDTATVM